MLGKRFTTELPSPPTLRSSTDCLAAHSCTMGCTTAAVAHTKTTAPNWTSHVVLFLATCSVNNKHTPSLKNIFMKKQELQIPCLEYTVWQFLWGLGKYFYCIPKHDVCLEESTPVMVCSTHWSNHFFHETPSFSQEQLTDIFVLADILLKIKWACQFWENN
jgi:hypothetical protein